MVRMAEAFHGYRAYFPLIFLFGEISDLQVVGVEKAGRGVADGGQGYLIIDLRLEQSEFGGGEFGLRVENKEIGFGAEFIFALV